MNTCLQRHSRLQNRGRQRGASLIIIVLMVLAMALTTLTAFHLSSNQYRLVANLQHIEQAFNRAEGALALGEEWLGKVIRVLEGNLDMLETALEGTAVDFCRPQGTYLAWLGFEAYDLDRAPTDILLNDYHIATNAGSTLGTGFEQWVRVNVSMSAEPWSRTVRKIREFAKTAPLK